MEAYPKERKNKEGIRKERTKERGKEGSYEGQEEVTAIEARHGGTYL
jgi:hypothetical protein